MVRQQQYKPQVRQLLQHHTGPGTTSILLGRELPQLSRLDRHSKHDTIRTACRGYDIHGNLYCSCIRKEKFQQLSVHDSRNGNQLDLVISQ
jgi:hypothetical protein